MTQNSQHIFEFLNACIAWLNQWNSMKGSIGKLTKETHSALLQTTSGLLRMAECCLEKKGFNYFLCGKVQTDKLEERFGKYRQQAGSNYNVSIRQVFESESKIRMQNTMPLILHSQCSGEIHIGINEIQVNDEPDSNAEVGISPFLKDVAHVFDEDLIIISDEIWPILVCFWVCSIFCYKEISVRMLQNIFN
jgi:hypothetical protein